jgi:enhancing lycopene biosynthesis protein 2
MGMNKVCIDEKNKLVTAPAYMNDKATSFKVFKNIG